MSLSNKTCDFEHLKSIITFNTTLVLFDKIAKLFSYSKVTTKDKKAAYDAINYLIKKIAYSRKSYLPQNAIDSLSGYKKALEDNGIAYYSSVVFVGDNNTDF
jgi:LacI family transcriptional regulator